MTLAQLPGFVYTDGVRASKWTDARWTEAVIGADQMYEVRSPSYPDVSTYPFRLYGAAIEERFAAAP